jgi:hypothetical protein
MKLNDMTRVEKEAMCYRLLVERDRINEALRITQKSLEEMDKCTKTKSEIPVTKPEVKE